MSDALAMSLWANAGAPTGVENCLAAAPWRTASTIATEWIRAHSELVTPLTTGFPSQRYCKACGATTVGRSRPPSSSVSRVSSTLC
eukprot:6329367-Pyramimonas_sp.AAC.1